MDRRRHVPVIEWRCSDARDRRRRSDEEMVPDDPASLGREAICLQSLQSGPQSPSEERDVPNVFSTPASSNEGALLPMPGRRLHDVAMGDQQSAPVRDAQGLLWLGGLAGHAHWAVVVPSVWAALAQLATPFSQSAVARWVFRSTVNK